MISVERNQQRLDNITDRIENHLSHGGAESILFPSLVRDDLRHLSRFVVNRSSSAIKHKLVIRPAALAQQVIILEGLATGGILDDIRNLRTNTNNDEVKALTLHGLQLCQTDVSTTWYVEAWYVPVSRVVSSRSSAGASLNSYASPPTVHHSQHHRRQRPQFVLPFAGTSLATLPRSSTVRQTTLRTRHQAGLDHSYGLQSS
jgi:hypothetical protein